MRQLIPPSLVSALLTALLATLIQPQLSIFLATAISVYVLFLLAASLMNPHVRTGGETICLFAALATLHLSYGLGYLLGLPYGLRAARRWGPGSCQFE